MVFKSLGSPAPSLVRFYRVVPDMACQAAVRQNVISYTWARLLSAGAAGAGSSRFSEICWEWFGGLSRYSTIGGIYWEYFLHHLYIYIYIYITHNISFTHTYTYVYIYITHYITFICICAYISYITYLLVHHCLTPPSTYSIYSEATNACLEAGEAAAFAAGASLVHDMRAAAVLPVPSPTPHGAGSPLGHSHSVDP